MVFFLAIAREKHVARCRGNEFPGRVGFEWLKEPLRVGTFVPPTPRRGQLGCFIQDPSQVHREHPKGDGIKKSCAFAAFAGAKAISGTANIKRFPWSALAAMPPWQAFEIS
jgi:hypothetical protein